MSCLRTKNNHFDRILNVTLHAMDRWMQRSKGDIREAIARAIPFGGQCGSATMLIDDEIVFVLERKKWTITTVLTKDQAIANIDMMSGGRRDPKPERPERQQFVPPKYGYAGGLVKEAPPVQVAAPPKHRTKKAEEADLMIRFTRMFRMSDEELATEIRETKNSLWRRVCEREQGLRRQIEKYKRDIQQMTERLRLLEQS